MMRCLKFLILLIIFSCALNAQSTARASVSVNIVSEAIIAKPVGKDSTKTVLNVLVKVVEVIDSTKTRRRIFIYE